MKHIHIGIRALLLVLCLCLMSVILAACGGGEETTAPDGNDGGNVSEGYTLPIVGSYHFAADGDERALRIEKNGYATMTVDGALCPGSCTPASENADNKNYTLTFRVGDKDVTYQAVYESGVLTVKASDGSEMRFLTAKRFTVSFDAQGGSSVASIKVQNGQCAVMPTPPTRQGYLFIGWCQDAKGTQPYAFSRAVTEDIKLYALWAPATGGDAAYTVRFDLCGGSGTANSVTTVGGKLYTLPTPTREGHTFGGWWYSSYESAEKPAYEVKAGETVLTESTTLYARWIPEGNKTPIITVSEGAVSWKEIPNVLNYTLTVTGPDGYKLIDGDTNATLTRSVDFANAPAGDYVIEVKAGNAVGVAYYQNKALPRVSFFEIINEKYLSFGAVAGAERYLITVKCGDAGHEHTDTDLGSGTSFLFCDCPMREGGIEFTVTAVAEGMLSSSRTYVYDRRLSPVTGLSYDESTELLTWNAVKNAMSYIVKVGNTVIDNGNKTSFSLKPYAAEGGKLSVSITPVTEGFNSPAPASIECKKDRLPAPTGIRAEGDALVWNAVSGATGYTVSVGGREINAQSNRITLTDLVAGTRYAISIRANGSKSSLWSDVVYVTYRSEPTGVRYENGMLCWDPVIGVDTYEIRINGGELLSADARECRFPVTLTAGNNTVSVRAADGSGAWVTLKVKAYSVSFDTRGGTSVGSLCLGYGDTIDPSSLPTPTKKYYTFGGWYNAPGGNAAPLMPGRYEGMSDTVYYAKWIPNTYDIALDAGEHGALNTEKVTVTYGKPFALPVPSAEDGHTFIGWYTLPGHGGEQITDETGKSLTTWNGEDRTLYAAWLNRALLFTETTTASGERVYAVEKGSEIGKLTELTIPAMHNGIPVAYIYSGAFIDCVNLEVINIPDTIRVIGSSAGDTTANGPFAYCRKLRAVNIYQTSSTATHRYSSNEGVLFDHNEQTGRLTLAYYPAARTGSYSIPMGVEVIPMRAFAGTAVASVSIPHSVTAIGENAFYNCKNLTEVTFTSSASERTATVIGDSAFRACTALSKVTLPQYTHLTLGESDGASDARLFTNIFYGCSSLAAIEMPGVGIDYSAKDGVLLNRNGNTLVYYPTGKRPSANLLPAGVATIGDYAFAGHMRLTEVTLPYYISSIGAHAFEGSTVKTVQFSGDSYFSVNVTVGDYAFYQCSKLQYVNISPDSRVISIGDSAFVGTDLQRIGLAPSDAASMISTIPKTVTAIGKNAFAGTRLKEVTFETGGTTLVMGEGAFADCIRLSSMTLPVCIERFVSTAFTGCTGLNRLGFTENSGKFSAENDAIYEKNGNGLSLVYYSGKNESFVVNASTTEIAADVFRGNLYLTSVTVPASVTHIGDSAFADCSKLSEVVFSGTPASLTLGEGLFRNAGITALVLPTAVTEIPEGMFENAKQFKSLTLHDGIKRIGENAFKNTALSSFAAPAALGEISAGVFEGVRSLTSLDLGSVTVIGANAFRNTGITALTISVDVTEIGDSAFEGAPLSGLSFAFGGSKPLFIDAEAFRSTGLSSVKLPSRLASLAANVFAESRVTSVLFENNTVNASDFSIHAEAFDGLTLGEVILPEGLTVIAEGTFANSSVTSVMLPKSVILIERGAFANAAKLSAIHFTAGGTALEIETMAFAGCSSLTSLSLPAHLSAIGNPFVELDSIKDGVVNRLTSLTVDAENRIYTVENNVLYHGKTAVLAAANATGLSLRADTTAIAEAAFAGAKLGNITLPATLETIGDCAFAYSTLADPCFPATVKSFGAYAFYFAGALGNVTFDGTSKLSSMGAHVFESSGLSHIVLPHSLKALPDYVFARTSAVVDFSLATEITVIPAYAFYGTGISTFTVPEGIVTIEGAAFAYSMLQSVTIASTVTNINTVYNYDTWYSMGAFTDSTRLTTVTFASPATGAGADLYIGVPGEFDPYGGNVGGSFEGCSSLTSIFIPARTVYIGQNSFYAPATDRGTWESVPNQISEILFESGSRLHTLDAGAFAYAGITELKLPDSVVELISGTDSYGNVKGPFVSCSNLKRITLPASVASVDFSLFASCNALEEIIISTDSETYATVDGVLFDKSLTTLIYYPAGKTERTYTVPESVTGIGDYAFNHTLIELFPYAENSSAYLTIPKSLSAVVLPSGLRSIGKAAFSHIRLQSINLGDTSLESLGEYAFYSSTLREAILPETLTVLGESVFAKCKSLKSLHFAGEGLESIPAHAFRGTVMQSVELPYGITSIGSGAFAECRALTTVTLPNSVVEMLYQYENTDHYWNAAQGIFESCEKLTEVKLPENTAFTTLPPALFRNCKLLTEVTIPDSVTVISTAGGQLSPFSGCTALKNVKLPSRLSSIEDGLFAGCIGMDTIQLPDGIQMIGANAFADCVALTEIDIPASVESIGISAFDGCRTLRVLALKDGIKSIGDYAFRDCAVLEELLLVGTVEQLGSGIFTGCKQLVVRLDYSNASYVQESEGGVLLDLNQTQMLYVPSNFDGEFILPETVTSIGASTFAGSAFTRIVLPEGIREIPESLFAGSTSLREVVLPESITSIGARAFDGCTALESIQIGREVTMIGERAFYGCTSLATVRFTEGGSKPMRIDRFAFAGCSSLCASEEGGDTLVLPGRLRSELTEYDEGFYLSATAVGASAFEDCTALERVVIGEMLNVPGSFAIGDRVFAGCSALKSITFPGNLGVFTEDGTPDFFEDPCIGTLAFDGCTQITELRFAEMPSTDLTFRVTERCFAGIGVDGEGIHLVLPPNIRFHDTLSYYRGDGTFEGAKLLSVTVTGNSWDPDGKVGQDTFKDCVYLTRAVLCEGVTGIGNSAFRDCVNLADVTLPSTLKSLDGNPFVGCPKVKYDSLANNEHFFYVDGILYDLDMTTLITAIDPVDHVVIPASVRIISSGAFSGFSNITSIRLHKDIDEIGAYAFAGTGISEIDLSVLTAFSEENYMGYAMIGQGWFMDCVNLKTVKSFAATGIETEAFAGCTSLTYYDFSGIEEIGARAFANSGLTFAEQNADGAHTALITLSARAIWSIGADAFTGCQGPIYVNCKAADCPDQSNWSRGWNGDCDVAFTDGVVDADKV